jgi:hypothetical protein
MVNRSLPGNQNATRVIATTFLRRQLLKKQFGEPRRPHALLRHVLKPVMFAQKNLAYHRLTAFTASALGFAFLSLPFLQSRDALVLLDSASSALKKFVVGSPTPTGGAKTLLFPFGKEFLCPIGARATHVFSLLEVEDKLNIFSAANSLIPSASMFLLALRSLSC